MNGLAQVIKDEHPLQKWFRKMLVFNLKMNMNKDW